MLRTPSLAILLALAPTASLAHAQEAAEQSPQEQSPQEQSPQEQSPQEQSPQEQSPQEQSPQEPTTAVREPHEVEPTAAFAVRATVPALARLDARPDALGSAVRHVDEATLRALAYADPDRVIARIPGVYVRSEDAYGLRPNLGLRGGNSHRSRRVMLLEDGIPLAYAVYSSPSIFSLLPMSRVVGVDVTTGAASLLYGPLTTAGAIDFRTRQVPERLRASVDVTYGLQNFTRAHFYVGGSDAHVGALIEGDYERSDGFQHVEGTPGTNSGFDLGDLAGRAFVRGSPAPGLQHELSARVVLQLESSRETYLGLSDADYRADPYRRYAGSALDHFDRGRTQASLTYEARWDDVRITVTGYRSDVRRTWYRLDRFRASGLSILQVMGDPTASDDAASRFALLTGARDSTGSDDGLVYVNNDWRYVSEGVTADGRGRATTGPLTHDVRFGARVHHDSYLRVIHADGYVMTGGQLTRDDTARVLQNHDLSDTVALSGYLFDAIAWGPLTVVPGVRIEHLRQTFANYVSDVGFAVDSTFVLPGGSLVLDPSRELRLFASAHRGFTPPLPTDAQTVRAESSTNYEAGARLESEALRLRGQLTGFFSDYDNITSTCTLTGGCTDEHAYNAGSAYIGGLEAALHVDVPIERLVLGLDGTYTYTGTRLNSAFTSSDPQLGTVEVGDALPYVPEHVGSASVTLEERDVFQVAVAGTFVGSMREVASQGDDGARTDTQALVDATASLSVGHGASVFVRVENLLGSTALVARRPWGARPTRPFQAQLGVRVDFE